MFPYPSGAGLHVGHPLGYLGTDVTSRFHRMDGDNVLHPMGYDAFGLPAEQYAVQTGQHPRITTEANIEAIRAQLRRLGVDHDDRRSFATIDPGYYKWTQWIFLQIFGSWFDEWAGKARRIEELVAELDAGTREPAPGTNPLGRPWAELDEVGRRLVVDAHRLAYLHQAPVNWCPGLGTVLSNEEVTADGRSERGNFPVFRRPLTQWMMRITAYADRLIDDLDRLDWSGLAEADAAQLDRPLDRCADRLRRRRRDRRGLHHPPRHAVRRHLHGAGARAPAGRRADRGRLARRHRPALDRGSGDPRRGRRGLPAAGLPPLGAGPPDRGPRQDRRLAGRHRRQPGQRPRAAGVHRRLRADRLRHRRDHGRARRGRPRLRVRGEVRPAGHPDGAAAGGLRRAARTPAPAR